MQNPPTETGLAAVPDWMIASLPWLAVALLLAAGAVAVGVWVLVGQLHRLERLAHRLDVLEDLRAAATKLLSGNRELDLRRIEHVLIEVRDDQRRVDDALLRVVEKLHSESEASAASPVRESLGERVVNRMLSMGYERVQVLSDREELDRIAKDDGEVIVEARRGGVLCKGRVLVREGLLADVDVRSAHSAFP